MVARRKPIAAQRSPHRESKPGKNPSNPTAVRRKPVKEPNPGKRAISPIVARRKPIKAQKSPAKELKPEKKLSNAERSAYFARREAAKVLRSALQGDARRRAVGSIKTLVYSPSIRNKKATFALVCQTLKHLSVIKDVLVMANLPSAKWKKQMELMYIITYDILFGQEVSLMGDAEKYLMVKKDALQSALSRILKGKGANVGDLVDPDKSSESRKPRYVRVNTLKIDTEYAIRELSQKYEVRKDDMVPDLLVLPPDADLHNHPLVKNGSVFLQGKASSMAAVALGPKPGWEVIDACSAPGNKTIHLAALMKGKGKIVACELDKERVKRLKHNVQLAEATNVDVKHEDFLNLNPNDPSYSKVRAILLDPSCSGSGTAFDRLDHLLPSHNAGHSDHANIMRLQKLAAFQKKVLEHGLSFPGVERVVYSTCSINQTENEDVVNSVMDFASSHGFQLTSTFPQWPRRGLPTFDGSEHLLRTDLKTDKEGFFIALFVRKHAQQPDINEEYADNRNRAKFYRRRQRLNIFIAKMLKVSPSTRFKLSYRNAKPSICGGIDWKKFYLQLFSTEIDSNLYNTNELLNSALVGSLTISGGRTSNENFFQDGNENFETGLCSRAPPLIAAFSALFSGKMERLPAPPDRVTQDQKTEGIVSYADVISKPRVGGWFRLKPIMADSRPPTYFDNIPACLFSASELEQSSKQFELALILKFSSGRPSLFDIKNHVKCYWNLLKEPVITLVDARHVLLIAENKEDMIKVQTQVSHRINTSLFRVFSWHMDFDFTKDSTKVPIWITLHRLPVVFMSPTLLEKIGNMLGKFLTVDEKTMELSNGLKPRICVEMDVSKELPSEMWLAVSKEKKHLLQIDYEGNNSFCMHCGLLGHVKGICRKLRTSQPEKGQDIPKKILKRPSEGVWQIIKPDLPIYTDLPAIDQESPSDKSSPSYAPDNTANKQQHTIQHGDDNLILAHVPALNKDNKDQKLPPHNTEQGQLDQGTKHNALTTMEKSFNDTVQGANLREDQDKTLEQGNSDTNIHEDIFQGSLEYITHRPGRKKRTHTEHTNEDRNKVGGVNSVEYAKRLIKIHKPMIFVLIEPKIHVDNISNVAKKLNFNQYSHGSPINHHICFFWDSNIKVTKVSEHAQALTFQIELLHMTFYLSGVYARCNRAEKGDLWAHLHQLNLQNEKWIIGGDFNTIRNFDEKKGGTDPNVTSLNDFNDFINMNNLQEVNTEGSYFTWCNNQIGKRRIYERLDRVLTNSEAFMSLPNLKVDILTRQCSDHNPMLLEVFVFVSFE
ncbi:hypothetical protein CASFOL_000143 [Castilleja foliolosa]|uniref:SAM-dependent MTase RsmB/NOP-type domain-containing protein n=1 Tax=Castilleja foliolosa TaxID=1961234 RepID=A0ABD3EPX2_9LAMI